MYRSGLVCSVRDIALYLLILLIKVYSCPAPPKGLDDPAAYQQQRTKAKTDALIMTQDVPTLWSKHGIVSDVIVRL